ncbi:MAG: hypothetical protein OXC57_04345 [Rhodobacteraceae bacterium]|nr:hypothetical protein [Paracoccaceae bacterium]
MKSSGSLPAAGDDCIRELENRLGEDGKGFLAFAARFRLQVEVNARRAELVSGLERGVGLNGRSTNIPLRVMV